MGTVMYWNWKVGGLVLGLVFFAAVALVKPIGVSTQFVIADGIVVDAVNPDLVREDDTSESGVASSNAYLDKSGGKYAKSVAHPLNYGMVFVFSMILGGFLGYLRTRRSARVETLVLTAHEARLGSSPRGRLAVAFVGGIIVLLGARLRGHTSSVKAIVFSPDGSQLASGSGDRTVRIWDTVSRAERARQARGDTTE